VGAGGEGVGATAGGRAPSLARAVTTACITAVTCSAVSFISFRSSLSSHCTSATVLMAFFANASAMTFTSPALRLAELADRKSLITRLLSLATDMTDDRPAAERHESNQSGSKEGSGGFVIVELQMSLKEVLLTEADTKWTERAGRDGGMEWDYEDR
jgi:hypothetical protein